MNKTAIKNFAIWARRELISRVSQKAAQYGITENDSISATADAVHGKVLSETEKKQRMSLIARIHRAGYSQTMEEIAYTWFNRFCALRFMEVNSYLPSLVRVFSDEKGEFKPQILESAIDLELDGLDREKVFAFKEANQTEELYQYLLITQCNALSSILPGMFHRIADETELLCPDNLLRDGSVIAHMVRDIPESDWLDAVQIIGWLYQYYNSEPKDQVFANLKKNIKISKENIPAATQLFTPDWIVRYMVENSLGRIFIQAKIGKWTGNEAERQAREQTIADSLGWKYYLPEAEQTKEVRAKINEQISECSPEKLKVIDPCMGSGHILVYLFDVLMQIYREFGYDNRDAVASILTNNLYGLDIDERAAQLAYFAVMMKARQYDRGFFRRKLQPKAYAVCESNDITTRYLDYFCKDDVKLSKEMHRLIKEFLNAREYGSVLNISPYDFSAANKRLEELKTESDLNAFGALMELQPLLQCAEAMVQKYDAVITNPPYMGGGGMSAKLSDLVKSDYPDSKADLFAVFMERCLVFAKKTGIVGMITMQSWMFLSSFEKLRIKFLDKDTILTMAHLGPRGFDAISGEVVQTTVFTISNTRISNYKGSYVRLVDGNNEAEKAQMFKNKPNLLFHVSAEDFKKIPGKPIAYWMSSAFINAFNFDSLDSLAHICNGFTTGDNDQFLRHWFEVPFESIDCSNPSIETTLNNNSKWFPYNKGGEYRKWYGNNEYMINWKNNGQDIKAYGHLVPRSLKYQFCESVSWSKVTSSSPAFRYKPVGTMFDVAGLSIFPNNKQDLPFFLALGNSTFTKVLLKILSPTLNYETGHISSIPVIRHSNKEGIIKHNATKCISISKLDWDSHETSWDFQCNPLVKEAALQKIEVHDISIAEAYQKLRLKWKEQTEELRRLEIENNRIFIELYGLQGELSPDVPWNEITLTCNPWYRYGRKIEDVSLIGNSFYMNPSTAAIHPTSKQEEECPTGNFPFAEETEKRLLEDTVKEFISYAVGCMMGRYSPEKPGLILANQGDGFAKYDTIMSGTKDNPFATNQSKKESFGPFSRQHVENLFKKVDKAFPEDTPYTKITVDDISYHAICDQDGIIPILDEDWFFDDIVIQFKNFLKFTFGHHNFADNLRFIESVLGKDIRKYFIKDFYADHLKMYQKRPIYWLFDSGKKGGFRALIYMHRYQPDMLARLRTDYIHEQQERYRTALADLEVRIDKASGSEKIKLEKQMQIFREQAEETRLYEERIHHLADQMIPIDLDDGVKHNYAIFRDVLAKCN